MTAVPEPPAVWPVCATCEVPWAYRRVLTMTGTAWMWTRDCKHRTATHVIHDENGVREL